VFLAFFSVDIWTYLSIMQLCNYVFAVGFAIYVLQNWCFWRFSVWIYEHTLFLPPKGTSLSDSTSLSYSAWTSLSTGLTCRRRQQKRYIKKFRCYISPLSPEAHVELIFCCKSWYGGISTGRNHIFTISYKPVKGFWLCEGSNFAI